MEILGKKQKQYNVRRRTRAVEEKLNYFTCGLSQTSIEVYGPASTYMDGYSLLSVDRYSGLGGGFM